MSQQNTALQQVDEIYNILKGNLRTALSSSLMMVTGTCIMLIPLMELIFENTIDIYIPPLTLPMYASTITFALRTAFYWTLFNSISHYFKKPNGNNIIRTQVFQITQWFPIIPIATGAVLGVTGNGDLVCPIVLILIGTLFAFFGQFSSTVVSTIAGSIVTAGVIGIYASSYAITYLGTYMLLYLGFSFIVMGYILRYEQKNLLDNQ